MMSSSKTRTSKRTNKQSSSSATAELTTSELEHKHKPEAVNPLMNPVVLSILFEICSGKELKNYRLVCKMWHKESLPRWRKSMRLQVYQGNYDPKLSKKLNTKTQRHASFHREKLSMGTLIKSVDKREKLGEYEFTVNHFRALNVDLITLYIHEAISVGCLPFWNSCAFWMHELYLSGIADNADRNYFSQLEIFLIEKLPHLKSLKLKIQYIERRGACVFGNIIRFNIDDENHNDNEIKDQEPLPTDEVKEHTNLKMLELDYFSQSSFPSSWVQFFRYFPNVQAITLNFRQSKRNSLRYKRVEKLLEAIHQVRQKDKTKLCIKHLKLNDSGYDADLDGKISNGVVDLFQKLNLPLQTLELELESLTPADSVAKIISCHSTTLKTLSLFRSQSDIAFPNFPFESPLENLTTLKLYGVIAANLSFLRYTPNLEELCMSVVHPGETVDKYSGNSFAGFISETKKYCDMSSVYLGRLYKLKLDFTIESSSNMKSLTLWMPNVQLFEGEINAGCFSVMCENWKHSLRELRLVFEDSIDDKVITGISSNSKKSSRKKSSLEVSELPGNITDLKSLQICEMKKPNLPSNDNVCSHLFHNITNISIREGFLKLPYLREISITMSEELTKSSRAELEQKQIKSYIKVSDSCSCGYYGPRFTRSRKSMLARKSMNDHLKRHRHRHIYVYAFNGEV